MGIPDPSSETDLPFPEPPAIPALPVRVRVMRVVYTLATRSITNMGDSCFLASAVMPLPHHSHFVHDPEGHERRLHRIIGDTQSA